MHTKVSAPMQTENGNQKIEIVLIEDNKDDINHILNVLRKANVCNPIKVLQDPLDALDYIFRTGLYAQQKPEFHDSLLLLSLNLAKMHGLDVLRKIKGDQRTKTLPVIMLTSSQEERGVMQSYKIGAQGCIVKPFDVAKFVEAVSELRLRWMLLVQPEQ
ncbi:MAG: response regulator [Verrucomicrobiales bacterium]